jgi:hypothetical protein
MSPSATRAKLNPKRWSRKSVRENTRSPAAVESLLKIEKLSESVVGSLNPAASWFDVTMSRSPSPSTSPRTTSSMRSRFGSPVVTVLKTRGARNEPRPSPR